MSVDFAHALLVECKSHHLHTAIETCGECPWESLERLLPVTDLIMMDIKQISGDKHRMATGKSNERILENARRLAEQIRKGARFDALAAGPALRLALLAGRGAADVVAGCSAGLARFRVRRARYLLY